MFTKIMIVVFLLAVSVICYGCLVVASDYDDEIEREERERRDGGTETD